VSPSLTDGPHGTSGQGPLAQVDRDDTDSWGQVSDAPRPTVHPPNTPATNPRNSPQYPLKFAPMMVL
jgi:hypothetical protein